CDTLLAVRIDMRNRLGIGSWGVRRLLASPVVVQPVVAAVSARAVVAASPVESLGLPNVLAVGVVIVECHYQLHGDNFAPGLRRSCSFFRSGSRIVPAAVLNASAA